jgi:hypothetical protein
MSPKSLFAGTILALALSSAAVAQDVAPPPAAPASAPAAPSDFKAGDVVKDNQGAVVGTVVKAGAASNGQLAVVVNIDGKDVSLPGNLFTVADGSVTALATKAQIEAAISKG